MGFESMMNGAPGRGRWGGFETFVGLMIYHSEKRKVGSESNELISLSSADLKESHIPDVPSPSRGVTAAGVPLVRLNGSDRGASVDSMCGAVAWIQGIASRVGRDEFLDPRGERLNV